MKIQQKTSVLQRQQRFPNNNYFELAKALFADDKIAEFKELIKTVPIHRKLKERMDLLTNKVEKKELDEGEIKTFEDSPHTSSGDYFVSFFDITFST